MSAQVPSSASGTVTLGMSVAQKLRRNTKITATTRAIVKQQGELHVLDRGADRLRAVAQDLDLDGGRHGRPQPRQLAP